MIKINFLEVIFFIVVSHISYDIAKCTLSIFLRQLFLISYLQYNKIVI